MDETILFAPIGSLRLCNQALRAAYRRLEPDCGIPGELRLALLGDLDEVGSQLTQLTENWDCLLDEQQHYQMLFQRSPMGIVLCTPDGLIVDANPAFLGLVGLTAVPAGRLARELTCPRDAPAYESQLQALAQGLIPGDAFTMEKRVCRPDGAAVWVREQVSLIRGEMALPKGLICLCEDITEQRLAQTELEEVKRHLEDEREAELLRVAQDIHDGPMQDLYAAVFSLTDALQTSQEEATRVLVSGAIEQVQGVIQNLRGISGELRPPVLIQMGLDHAVRGYLERFQHSHKDLDVQFYQETAAVPLPVHAAMVIFRVFQHSLMNVVRHARASRLVVRIHYPSDPPAVCLEIADNGRGFALPARWVEWLREGHYGLVGSMERIQNLGGRLQVESAPGQGTRLTMTVPISQPPAA